MVRLAKLRRGTRLITDTTAQCIFCHRHLPHGAFYRRQSGPLGLSAECRECRSEKRRAEHEWTNDFSQRICVVCGIGFDPSWTIAGNPRRRGAGPVRDHCSTACRLMMARAKIHGIEPSEYYRLTRRCAACGHVRTRMTVDHDHDRQGAAAVRGGLCRLCNSGIGFLGDSVDGVTNALLYLARRLDGEERSALAARLATALVGKVE